LGYKVDVDGAEDATDGDEGVPWDADVENDDDDDDDNAINDCECCCDDTPFAEDSGYTILDPDGLILAENAVDDDDGGDCMCGSW
jgi:hypothetical protein